MYNVTFKVLVKNHILSESYVAVPDVQLVYTAYRLSLLTQLCS